MKITNEKLLGLMKNLRDTGESREGVLCMEADFADYFLGVELHCENEDKLIIMDAHLFGVTYELNEVQKMQVKQYVSIELDNALAESEKDRQYQVDELLYRNQLSDGLMDRRN